MKDMKKMKEITINVKLKIQEDLDEQDILDHTSHSICQEMHDLGVVEFIDAELAEPPKIDVVSLINDVIAGLLELQPDGMDDQYTSGAVNGLKQLKDMIEHDKIPVLFPDLNKLSGENLTLSMRLTKAEKLLSLAHAAIFTGEHYRLAGEIAEFLNDLATERLNATPGSAPSA
jgi:hypothetical protein